MPTRQQPTTRTRAMRSIAGALLLIFCFGISPVAQVFAQEPSAPGTNSLTASGTVPDLITETVNEDADWTALNVTLASTQTVSIDTAPINGSARVTGNKKDIEYKPNADYCNTLSPTSTDNFDYEVKPDGIVAEVKMTVTCVNDAPQITAPGATQNVNQDATLTLPAVSIDDVDAGAGNLKLDLTVNNGGVTLASTTGLTALSGNGTGSVSAKGSLTNLNKALNGLSYAPTSGYFGNDSLSIGINDQGNSGSGGAETDSATVAIKVNALPPTVNNDTDDTDQDLKIDIDVLANDAANSGSMDPSSVAVTKGPTNGVTTVLGNGKIRYAPGTGYVGVDEFTYKACNDGEECDTASVSVTVKPLKPTVNDDTAETNEDTDKKVNVLANDVANTGTMNTNSVVVVDGSEPTHGTATPQGDGKILYSPNENYNGSDSFTYRACNSAGECGTADVDVTVKTGNDGPSIEPIDDQVMIEGSTKTVSIVVGDIDSDNLSVWAQSDNTALIPNENLIVSGTGNNRTLQISATDNAIGRANITVFVSDGDSQSTTAFAVSVIAPDLSVSIDDGGISVRPGGTVAYAIAYGNSPVVHTSDAAGVYIAVSVPAHSQFNPSTSSSGWNCTNSGESGDVCRLDIGQLNRGATGSTTFAVDVDVAIPTEVDRISVEAEIADNGQNGNDIDPSNNRNGDTTPIDRTVLLLASKRDLLDVSGGNDGIAGPGDRIDYTITLNNDSVTTALGSVFDDAPDANTTLEVGSVTSSQGEITQGNTAGDSAVSVALGGFAPSVVVTIEFSVIINTPVPDGVIQVTNQGAISGENFPTVQTDDPDTPNVGDATVTPLGAIPVLNAAKRAGLLIDANQDELASPGDTLIYTVTLGNLGVVNATEMLFSDRVDPNTKLVNGSVMITDPSANIISGNNSGDTGVTIDIGTLNGGEVVTVTFAAQIDANLPEEVVQVENQGIISSKEIPLMMTDNPDTPEPNDPTKTPVVIKPIIVALKSYTLVTDADNNEEPSPGDTIEYIVNIRNDGTRASGVVFTDELDTYVRLTRKDQNQPYVQTSRGTVVSGNDQGDTTVVVTMDELGTGDDANISFKVKIAATVPAELLFIENQGVVSTAEVDDALTDDPKTPAQNDVTKTPITGLITLEPTLTARMIGDMDGSNGYSEGDIVVYTVTVLNTGNRAADATLAVPLDSRTEIYSDTNFPKPELPLPLGTIPAGEQRVQGIIVRLVNLGESEKLGNQFAVNYFDPDANMPKEIPTDDPATEEVDDPTVIGLQSVIQDLYLPIVSAAVE